MYWIIIIATLAATSLMTPFSYLTAWLLKQPYKEPFLLAVLLNYFHVIDTKTNKVIGWLLHYVLGLLFVGAFQILLSGGWATLSWSSALLYGAVIGVIGILGWQLMFMLAPKTPRMNYIGYYAQLFIAHLVFALTMVGCYKLA